MGTLSEYSPNNHSMLALAIGTWKKFTQVTTKIKIITKNENVTTPWFVTKSKHSRKYIKFAVDLQSVSFLYKDGVKNMALENLKKK